MHFQLFVIYCREIVCEVFSGGVFFFFFPTKLCQTLIQCRQKHSCTSALLLSLITFNVSVLPSQQGPDYRLYKSEPELTTVTEVDENNGEERAEHQSEHPGNKGSTGSRLISFITRRITQNAKKFTRTSLC